MRKMMTYFHVNSLEQLKSTEACVLYPRAAVMPEIFARNLLSDRKIVKEFKGDDALVRAFYYQLMKLSFEIEVQRKDYCQALHKILTSDQIFDDSELDDKKMSGKQYRSFLKEFINLVKKQDVPSFQKIANQYPIIDEILHMYFRKLVPIPLYMEGSDMAVAEKVYAYLAQLFSIKIKIISGCFKFEESDVFVYVKRRNQVYLAYLEELVQIPEVSETESEIQQNISMDNADMSPKDNFRTPTKESTLPLESTTNPTVINILENKQKDPVVEPRYSFSKKVYMRQPESASTIGSSVSIAMHKTIDKPRATIGSPLNQGTPVKESKATPLSYSVNLASPIKPGNERNNENARTLNSQTSQSSQKQLSNSRKLLNRPKITMRAQYHNDYENYPLPTKPPILKKATTTTMQSIESSTLKTLDNVMNVRERRTVNSCSKPYERATIKSVDQGWRTRYSHYAQSNTGSPDKAAGNKSPTESLLPYSKVQRNNDYFGLPMTGSADSYLPVSSVGTLPKYHSYNFPREKQSARLEDNQSKFTDKSLLKLLDEPYRLKIQQIKSAYKVQLEKTKRQW